MFGICHLSVVPCRREASDRSELVTQLLFGEAFEVLEQKESWHRILTAYDHYECWIDRKQYVPIPKASFDNLRHNPAPVCSEMLQLITDVKSGQSFPIPMGSSLPFYANGECLLGDQVYAFDGQVRSFDEPTTREQIVQTAMEFLHSPYLWGGRSLFGIDCSGFTQLVFKVNGLQLKRDAYQQVEWGDAYSFVEEAQPGDLAFFDNEEGRIVHVGIVAGENRIIHASGRVRIDHYDHYGIFTPERGGYTHNLRIIKNIM